MNDRSTTTPRIELAQLHAEAGLLPMNVRHLAREALSRVPNDWNAAVADHPQDIVWRDAIRREVCSRALAQLSSSDLSASMDQMLKGSVRQNLINLGAGTIN